MSKKRCVCYIEAYFRCSLLEGDELPEDGNTAELPLPDIVASEEEVRDAISQRKWSAFWPRAQARSLPRRRRTARVSSAGDTVPRHAILVRQFC